MPNERFASWLARQLVRRDMTPADLARALSTQNSTVSMWMNGKRTPSPPSCLKIADALNVDQDTVLEIAGHRERVPLTHLEQWHAVVDPLLQKLPFEPETVFDVRADIEHIVRVREMKRGKRSSETFWDPVEVDTDEEE